MSRERKYMVKLSDAERNELERFVSTGVHRAQEITRARILLAVTDGCSDKEIATRLGISAPTISHTTKRFASERLGAILDRPRSGAPGKITPEICAHITAVASTTPPPGYAAWTMQMVADKVVEQGLLSTLSDESVRLVLKKRFETSPQAAMVCCST
jgi:transposase